MFDNDGNTRGYVADQLHPNICNLYCNRIFGIEAISLDLCANRWLRERYFLHLKICKFWQSLFLSLQAWRELMKFLSDTSIESLNSDLMFLSRIWKHISHSLHTIISSILSRKATNVWKTETLMKLFGYSKEVSRSLTILGTQREKEYVSTIRV